MSTGSGTCTYNVPLDTDPALKAAALASFGTKNLHFILGAADACNCNSLGYTNDAYCFPLNGSLNCPPNEYGGPGCCDT